MKKLMQVDLSSMATPVVTKKRVYKKRKVEEKEERPSEGGKSISSFPVKEKKPPTEKQLAAREKLKQARLAKIEQVKAEKARLDEEVRLKEEEIAKKKKELAEKRKLKREEKKKQEPQLPVVQSEPARTGQVEDKGPTISQVLQNMGTSSQNCTPAPPTSPLPEFRCGNENHNVEMETIPEEPSTPPSSQTGNIIPGAPKREYVQRFRPTPFGRAPPPPPRFR